MPYRLLLAGLLCVTAGGVAQADLLRLKSGGELRGKVVKSGAARNPDRIAVETLSGAVIVVERSEISLLSQRPLPMEEYETRLRHLPDTLQAHWELAGWCKSKGLSVQRELHLQRVVEIDPDHEKAHVELGHRWKDGGWVDWDEYMAARGYVKHKGKYVTQQELDLIEKTDEERKREQEWYPRVKLWSTWLTSRDGDRAQQGLAGLRTIKDDDSTAAVLRFLGDHAARDVRLLGVEVLTKAEGKKSAQALAKIALRDDDPEVRQTALVGIAAEQYETVQALFIKELRNGNNVMVCRAGLALQRVGDERAVAALIESLVTTHHYQVRVPAASPSYTFTTDGSTPNSNLLPPDIEAGLRTGQFPNGVIVLSPQTPRPMKTMVVRHDHTNAEVLTALRKLSGENYGYDERLWRLWWAAKKAEGGGLKS